ncbi:hypothetical protein S7711_10758 [Stachybotrys chartarum IBT 7711]|uniref:Uncharacterized protein n=1 Tax=Stachybotrys chartarum (strain CBS 109288 / IBT 7711) TaxID=1280523 RepID=A0A084AWV5_STACB|nr:hypothetical protein S7711_10758 [Stachybotrys chartarum IBT 7711]
MDDPASTPLSSTLCPQFISFPSSVRLLRQRIAASLQIDLASRNHVNFDSIYSRFLRSTWDAETLQIARHWLFEPLLVPDSDLAQILPMKQSTATSPKETSTFVCYFRSWPIRVSQLRCIMLELMKGGFSHDQVVREWDLLLKNMSADTMVTVRYVGVTDGENAYARVVHTRAPENSLQGNFTRLVDRMFPAVGSADRQLSDLYRDQLERAAIGFFSFRTLLNSQKGGRQILIPLNIQSECAFYRCRTRLLAHVDEMAAETNAELHRKVRDLLGGWQRQMHQKFKSARSAPEESWRFLTVALDQATPQQTAQGYCLVSICGEHPPWATVRDGSSFLSGERASSAIVRNVLQSLAQLEQSKYFASIDSLERIMCFSELLYLPNLTLTQANESRSARLALAADHQSKQMRRKRRLSESELQSLDTQLQHLLGQDESQQYLAPDAERQGYLDGQLSRILPRKKRRPGYTEITRRIISENLTTSASDESKPKDEKKNSAVNFLFALPNHYMLVVERYGRVATTQGKLEQAVALFSTPVSILYRFNMPQESDWIEWFIKQPSGYYIAACLEARESVGSLSPEKRAYLTTQLEDVQRLHDWRSRLEVLNNETQNCMAFQADWLQFLKSTKQKQQPRPVHGISPISRIGASKSSAYRDLDRSNNPGTKSHAYLS